MKNADKFIGVFFMQKYSKAFTMIELIAIMVIVSILATSVITSYSNYIKWHDIKESVL